MKLRALTLAVMSTLSIHAVHADVDQRLDDLEYEIDQVNREDMRVKRGEVDGDTMTLRVEDMAKSRGRDEIFGRDVDIDVSSLNQADEVAENASEIDRVERQSKKRDAKQDRKIDKVERQSKKRDDKLQRNIDKVERQSEKRDARLQRNIDRVERQSERRDRKQDRKINRNARNIAANAEAIADNAADIAANSADIAANSAAIADNAREITRVESESIARDEAIMDYVIEDQARQDALIADNAAEIDRVESESIARDELLSEAITRETNDRIIMDERIQAQVDANRTDINANYNRIVDTNARIDLLDNQVAEHEMRINGLAEDISHLRSDMYSGLAGVAAMGAIPEARSGSTSIGIGYGNFGGTEAGAFGISHRSESGKHAFKLSGTITQRENGFSAGYSYSF